MSAPEWNLEYFRSLQTRFQGILNGLEGRLDAVIKGRVAPALDDISIGSARYVRAAILFFDIRGFSERASSPEPEALKRTLLMLDCVIPMVMHVVHDFGGYVEKNTGDGIMALFEVGQSEDAQSSASLEVAGTVFCMLREVVNPALVAAGIESVSARIGIDIGEVLIARLGVPSGSALHNRNFLTAIGPAANIACRLQQAAYTDDTWVGDRVRRAAPLGYVNSFEPVFPSDWNWIYRGTTQRYTPWRFTYQRVRPFDFSAIMDLLNPKPPR